MLTLKQWGDQMAAARKRVPLELEIVVASTAKLGGEVARGEIGTLQPSLTIASPFPARVEAWETLAFKTISDKIDLGFGPPDYDPLFRTGEMEASIEGVSEGLTGAIVSSDRIMVYHEFGTTKMPPRPVLARALITVMPSLREALLRVSAGLLKPLR